MPQAMHNELQEVTMPDDQRHPARRHHFLAAWVRSPFKIGGLLPSSRALARAMAVGVDVKKPGAVIELGAGTGVVTHALLQAGIAPGRLVVIERDEKLHAIMSSQFPHLNILCADAITLDTVLAGAGVTKINSIVSSLPLLSMPKAVRQAIEHQMATLIGHDGCIVQFTYGPTSPISAQQMHKYHLHGRRMKLVMANIPPAHVWVYRKSET